MKLFLCPNCGKENAVCTKDLPGNDAKFSCPDCSQEWSGDAHLEQSNHCPDCAAEAEGSGFAPVVIDELLVDMQAKGEIRITEWTEGALTIYHCPFDGTLPVIKMFEGKPHTRCDKMGCPAALRFVELEVWNRRGPHEDRVKHIDSEMPIFILQAKDALVQGTMSFWLSCAEPLVNTGKYLAASADYQAMMKWQQENAELVKIPD